MRKLIFIIFLVPALPCRIQAQLKEIRAIQQQLPLIKDSSVYVDALNRLGVLFHLKSIDTCFYYAEKAKAIADRLQYQKGLAGALRNFGVVHLLKRNTYLALKYFNKCLPLYRSLHDSAGECHVLMSIGNTMATQKRFSEAFLYLRAAYNIGKTLKNDSVQSLVIVNLVNDTTLSNDSVTRLLNKATEIASRYNDYRLLITVDEARAELLTKEGRNEEALALIENGFRRAKELGVEYQVIDEGIHLGDMFLAGKDTVKAIGYYKDALNTAEIDGYKSLMTDAAQKLYDYYSQLNDVENSSVYAAKLIKNYQDYQHDVQRSGIDYLDYALKEVELENLRDNEKVTNNVVIILSVLLATFMALLFFVFRSYRARKKYVELLKERNEQAGNRNAELQDKNEFNNKLISVLAHDFRQPLSAAKGMMGLLKEPGRLSQEEIDFLVNRIETSSETSLEIFDNILHWIKKQVSGFVYEPENLLLKNLVGEAAISLQYITEKFEVRVINDVTDGTVMTADKEMLQFVNRNLIHNAIKFSPANSSITIGAVKTGNEIIVSVKDQGKGMNPEKLASLFNIFAKMQHSSEKEKGSGVALVICKDFLERMHGRIWAESEPGKGTTFFYALPAVD